MSGKSVNKRELVETRVPLSISAWARVVHTVDNCTIDDDDCWAVATGESQVTKTKIINSYDAEYPPFNMKK